MQNVFSVIAVGLLSIASLEKGHLQEFASLQELTSLFFKDEKTSIPCKLWKRKQPEYLCLA